MYREILHVDMNSFYASVELIEKPELKGLPVAVGGNEENLHGIILAKTPEAKAFGVNTGEAIWEAKKKCPHLILLPPNYEKYLKISKAAQKIYYGYTNFVEGYGMDECWLDVTASKSLFGNGEKIGYEIKERIKRELKVSVSVGVSFNKVFAKLGSDMNKPDALTVISPDNFKEKIWNLDVSEMIMIGRSTKRKLHNINIKTLGDLARADVKLLKGLLGINGVKIWLWANGKDETPVLDYMDPVPIKTIGKGITCSGDLINDHEVKSVIQKLAQDVSQRLIENKFLARGINIYFRDTNLHSMGFDTLLVYPTNSSLEISQAAMDLFLKHHNWNKKIRSI